MAGKEESRGLGGGQRGVPPGEPERRQPEATHPIGILMGEHKIILQNLEELRLIVGQIEAARGLADIGAHLDRLDAISHLLLDTESHHKREEEALFPRLEAHGVTGPPRMMRLEHEGLRAKKRRLAELVSRPGSPTYEGFVKGLSEVSSFIVNALRDHIYKEDNILYPMALDTLGSVEWGEVLKDFEGIGYCCFTPGKER